jgi:hypothetical protein
MEFQESVVLPLQERITKFCHCISELDTAGVRSGLVQHFQPFQCSGKGGPSGFAVQNEGKQSCPDDYYMADHVGLFEKFIYLTLVNTSPKESPADKVVTSFFEVLALSAGLAQFG